ncbi:MAG TPA: 3-hydroxyacyl-CoA dehydrogenase family protein [Candidatus Sulfotelmatobacter sp.]|nr:3-hydroxyacyl-CoA dehydrogenase family protein [Candidatus Sulfotelmatobacter sp.]
MAEIRTIAVIGAGFSGRNIAQLSALGGFRTILEDILPASLRKAESEIRDALDRSVAKGIITRMAASAAFGQIEYATSIEQAARAADLIIEAVPVELESKLEIFILLDKVARPATILASSTDMFSVTELASVTYRAQKIPGMLFSVSADGTGLLEIVRGQQTDDATAAACLEVGRRMGRKTVVIAEAVRSAAQQ